MAESYPRETPFFAKVTVVKCIRCQTFKLGHKKQVALEQDYVTPKRQYSHAKYCYCEFRLKIIESTDKTKYI